MSPFGKYSSYFIFVKILNYGILSFVVISIGVLTFTNKIY